MSFRAEWWSDWSIQWISYFGFSLAGLCGHPGDYDYHERCRPTSGWECIASDSGPAEFLFLGSATYCNGYELDVITAVILGGTSLRGGSGSVARTVIGALLIGMINNRPSLLNVSTHQQLVAKGLIIVIAISFSDWLIRWAEK